MEKEKRKQERLLRKRQKVKEKEAEQRQKEEEMLGPDPELYAKRMAKLEEEEQLRRGQNEQSNLKDINEGGVKKMSKEELEQRAVDMQKRAEQLEREREERHKEHQGVEKTQPDVKLKEGIKPKFVNDISKSAYVDHNMDLAESINRKKHYNQRFTEH
jgi:hypothetical protein